MSLSFESTRYALLITALAIAVACGDDSGGNVDSGVTSADGSTGCPDGTTQACGCMDGSTGVSMCGSGSWSACMCDGTPLCAEGATQACACGDGTTGTQTCAGGAWGTCDGCGSAPMCTDFATGSTPFEGEAFYEPCDQVPPTNCATGAYILLGEARDACYCALRCSDFDPPKSVGEACDTGGQTTCTHIVNRDGSSYGDWCLTDAWIALDLDCSE